MHANIFERPQAADPPWEVVEGQPKAEASLSLAPITSIEKTLADVEARHKGVVYDLATTKGNDAARKARQELVTIRTTADKVYEAWNKPIVAAQKQARELRDGFKARVLLLEEPLDKAIKEDEARRAAEKKAKEEAEAKRVKAIRDQIAVIYAMPAAVAGRPSQDIELAIRDANSAVADKAFFEELQGEAEAAAEVVLTKLNAMLAAAKEAEAKAEAQRLEAERLAAERAEIERQRAELAAQQEAARKAAEEAEAARQAEEARLEQERQAELARQAAAEQARLDAIAQAEREAAERIAEQQRQLDAQQAAFEAAQAAARPTLERVETLTETGATVVVYKPQAAAQPPAESAVEEPPAEPVKPPVTEQIDAFEKERAEAEAQAAADKPLMQFLRPSDERITAAVAKAFGVAEMVAAEWLGSYDVIEEIARVGGAA